MEISIFTAYILDLFDAGKFATRSEAFERFYRMGVRLGDMMDYELERTPLHLYCDLQRASGIKPQCLISLLNVDSPDAREREDNLARVKGYIDQLHRLEVPRLMLAPQVKPAKSEQERNELREYAAESYRAVIEYAKGAGVAVVAENHSSVTRPDSRLADIQYLFEQVPELGFILDTGNFYLVGEDVMEAYRQMKDRLVYIHAKDWRCDPFGSIAQENLPRVDGAVLGEGILPLKELLQTAMADGYQGNVLIEINSHSVTLERLEASAHWLRDVCRLG